MPSAMHPQAKFDPIPPDLDLHSFVDDTPNFDWVVRISTAQIRRLGPANFERLVGLHVVEGGKPLVIEGWNKVLPDSLFSAKWLERTYDKKQENVRDLGSQTDIPMTTGHYIRSMRQLTNQWSPLNFRDERRQRLYLKDIDCPLEWYEHLKKVIPPNLFYMNENVSEQSGADSRDDDIFGAPEPTAAIAGDLMSSLPEEMRAQNLMCYIGHEGTYTPAHREMCASLGQNIMVHASGDQDGEKPGSSIWFMTETKDREVVREYFLSMLGHDIEIEKHFAQINAWKKANFPVYVVEQKVGDFILVPPLAPHQVWNRGTRTMKVAWNRTTVETLGLALREALPKARLVCRDEQYKNKAIIYYTLEKYYKQLQSIEENPEVSFLGLGRELTSNSPRLKQMAEDFRRLFGLFTDILVDEMFGYKQMDVEYIEFDSNITCSYCRSNIFNRFLTCKCCVRQFLNDDEDTYDICMECYAMGRSCVCISGLQWCEQWRWADLVEKHETWRAMVIKQDGFIDMEKSPQPLELARRKTGKKAVAQICQEQLRRRPWNDITKLPEPAAPESEGEPEVDDKGRVKKKKPKRKRKKGDTHRCHVCCHKDYTYRLSFCTTCTEAYCFGVLWRAFDIMPQEAMEKEHWQCPKCLGICNCGACRRTGNTTPYVPKNTLLGHDTRKIADDRSVESIVDFRVHNLGWLKGAGEQLRSKDSKRMQRLKEKADSEKAKGPLAVLDSADDAPHEMDTSMQDITMGDHADESQAVDPDASHNGEPATASGANGGDSRVQVADMSGNQNEEGDSVYPDPTDPAIRNRMMGMGFYDQDDISETDRILFDAFQMPSAEALNGESDVSEFVKKALRLAKRKARLENDDDPDFLGPRSHKKKPKTGNIDQLMNLDPALMGVFGASGSGSGTPIQANGQSGLGGDSTTAASGENLADSTPGQSRPKMARPPLPIDPLRPTLRHARPTQSYVDAEEEPLDDAEDILPNWFDPPSARNSTIANVEVDPAAETDPVETDPVEIASQAFRRIAESSMMAESTPKSAETSSKMTGKRRGRPSRSSLPSESAVSAPSSASKEPGRGGRPRKSSMSQVEQNDDTEMVDRPDVQDGDDDVTAAAVEDQLEAPVARQRRGRPPGRKAMPEAKAPSPEPEPGSVPVPRAFMSMAERMAASGKKIKIRAKSDGPASSDRVGSTPLNATRSREGSNLNSARREGSAGEDGAGEDKAREAKNTSMRDADDVGPVHGRPELNDDDLYESEAESSDSSVTPEPEPELLKIRKSGPTVVKLGLLDSSSVASEIVSDDSDSGSEFDEDDEDIPAKPRFVATRGGRGRGRGRGGHMFN